MTDAHRPDFPSDNSGPTDGWQELFEERWTEQHSDTSTAASTNPETTNATGAPGTGQAAGTDPGTAGTAGAPSAPSLSPAVDQQVNPFADPHRAPHTYRPAAGAPGPTSTHPATGAPGYQATPGANPFARPGADATPYGAPPAPGLGQQGPGMGQPGPGLGGPGPGVGAPGPGLGSPGPGLGAPGPQAGTPWPPAASAPDAGSSEPAFPSAPSSLASPPPWGSRPPLPGQRAPIQQGRPSAHDPRGRSESQSLTQKAAGKAGQAALAGLTGGLTKALPPAAQNLAGNVVGKVAIAAAKTNLVIGLVVVLVIVALFTGGVSTLAAMTGGGIELPDKPSAYQASLMPPGVDPEVTPETATPVEELEEVYGDEPGWADVVWQGQEASADEGGGVPWTILAAIARVQSDFGRRSPYDTLDRTPGRDLAYGLPPGMTGSSGAAQTAAMTYNGPVLAAGGDLAALVSADLSGRVDNPITSLSAATLAEVVDGLATQDPLPDTVLVISGDAETEDSVTKLPTAFAKMAKLSPQTTFQVVTVHRPDKPGLASVYNAAVAAAASANKNIKVVAWAKTAAKKPNWFTEAGEMTPAGVAALARQLKELVATAGVGGWVHPINANIGTAFGVPGDAWSSGYHTGVDFPASPGTPVYAARSGTVTLRGDQSWAGPNFVTIDHGIVDGVPLVTWYAHMSAATVSTGQQISAGEQVGNVGSLGNSSGPHLHFETRTGLTPLDPTKYLPPSNGSGNTAMGGLTGLFTSAGPPLGSSCAVPTPMPPIGGDDDEGVGPFLLTPSAADDVDGDPQNPCDAAEFVGEQLADIVADSDRLSDVLNAAGVDDSVIEEWVSDDEAARGFWGAVVEGSNLFVDASTGDTTCTAPISGPESYEYAIRSIFTCTADTASLYTAVVDVAGDIDTISGHDAAAKIADEAVKVAWNFSEFDLETCDNTDNIAGLFPLTAAVASKYDVTDRCDPLTNIQAAAQAVVDGESVALDNRSGGGGKYAQMFGGWASMPWALGRDRDLFAVAGPAVDWRAPAECEPATAAWVNDKANALGPWLDTAAADGFDAAERRKLGNDLGNGPRNGACGASSAPDADWWQFAAVTAEGAADALVPVAAPEPTTAPDGTTEETAPEMVEGALTAEDELLRSRLMSLATFAMSQVSSQPTPEAKPGRDSVIPRLSAVAAQIATPNLSSTGSIDGSSVEFPFSVAVIDYAIKYGGIRPDWDTTDPSVLEAAGATIANAAYMAAGGSVAEVIAAARSQIGVPYSWGGGGPAGPSYGIEHGASIKGFDCSGLMEYAYSKIGQQIGGTSRTQVTMGTAVEGGLANALPGDLLFWGNPTYHVALYIGDGRMIEAPRTGLNVREIAVYGQLSAIRRIVDPEAASTATAGYTYTPTSVDAKTLAAKLQSSGGAGYAELFVESGKKYKLDPALLAAVAMKESSFRPDVINCTTASSAGAKGMMQFMPATAGSMRIDPCNPASAVDGAGKYLSGLLARLGSLQRALAGYNWGEGNVSKYGLGGMPSETRDYVTKVPQLCQQFGGCNASTA